MFGRMKQEDTLRRIVTDAVEDVVRSETGALERRLRGFKDTEDLQRRVTKLKEEIETLKIEKGRREEEFSRREREVEHKVGLERKRQEFEVEQAKREAAVTLREENLKAERERFEGEMKFTRQRFEEEVGYLKDMVGKVLERLPSAEIIANLNAGD